MDPQKKLFSKTGVKATQLVPGQACSGSRDLGLQCGPTCPILSSSVPSFIVTYESSDK